tara:strand:+ start:109 stop:516 length:408 start_codon:yes stop_codon:yes gene_type:complete
MVNNYIWSNAYWNFFHTFSYNLNENKINEKNLKLIIIFVNTLINVIPCERCKVDTVLKFEHLNYNNLKTKKEFVFFFYNFHNYVNKKTRKKNLPIKILDKYNNISPVKYLKIIDEHIYKYKLNKDVYRFFKYITS